jgi:hypothetical protein
MIEIKLIGFVVFINVISAYLVLSVLKSVGGSIYITL